MNDQSRGLKWAFVGALIALSIALLFPHPGRKLKGGIDLAGGTSLLYEIDTTGIEPSQQSGMAQRVMEVLKQRVDPSGQMNLEWRPIGNTRLEIRMPLPSKEALESRAAYNRAIQALREHGLTRSDIDLAVSAGTDRDAELAKLIRGDQSRRPLLEALKSAADAYQAAQQGADHAVAEAARAAYEKAIADLVATTMPVKRLEDVLALDPALRKAELEALKKEFPSYAAASAGEPSIIDAAVAAYDAWAEGKTVLEDPSDLKRLLRGAGVLEFGILAERDRSSPARIDGHGASRLNQDISIYTQSLAKFGPRSKPGDSFRWYEMEKIEDFVRKQTGEKLSSPAEFDKYKDSSELIFEKYAGKFYVLAHNDPEFIMSAKVQDVGKKWKLKGAYADRDPMTGQNIVIFQLDGRGGDYFGALTGANVNRQMSILLDNRAMSHAVIREAITGGSCRISGNFAPEDVQYLVRTLDAGALPARLKEQPISEKTIGPSLGETNRTKGITSAMWAMGLIFVCVVGYYGLIGGNVANFALILNLLFVLAIMSLMQATFTLPGIAGMVLTLGMAIDANVLIFERYREERARGVVFRKAIFMGYDRAFSTIIDSNLTTFITCVILGLVSTEEVKGFAIVLGLGICTSLFTSLFVTRLVFETLIARGWLTDMPLRRTIGVPNIDWIGLRRYFLPFSAVICTAGLGLFFFVALKSPDAIFDIEFLGGTSVTIDLKPGVNLTDEQVSDLVSTPNRTGGASARDWLHDAADRLQKLVDAQKTGESSGTAPAARTEATGRYTLAWRGVSGDVAPLTDREIASLMQPVMYDAVERGGVSFVDGQVVFETKPGAMSFEQFNDAMATAVGMARDAAENVRKAKVQRVVSGQAGGAAAERPAGLSYDVTTVKAPRELVQVALLGAMGDKLQIQRPLSFTLVEDDVLTRAPYFAVLDDYAYLNEVFPDRPEAQSNIQQFKGGVAVRLNLAPSEHPVTVAEMEQRLKEVRLREDADQSGAREWKVFPLGPSAAAATGGAAYREFAVLAVDEVIRFSPADQKLWEEQVAQKELSLVSDALSSEKSLSKVVQFAPQVAAETKQSTIFGVILALIAVVIYVWIRFGTAAYGLASIIALFHDVCITLGAVTLSHFIYNTVIGRALNLSDFKFDLAMVAAILTVIGYSINDSIVVFDRIRENKGKLGALSAAIINNSINQTLSRTLLTGTTTLFVLIVMFFMGGEGIKGFNWAMIVGLITGTYSSVGVAAPLLYRPALLRGISLTIGAAMSIGVVFAMSDDSTVRIVLSVIAIVGFIAWGMALSRKASTPRGLARA